MEDGGGGGSDMHSRAGGNVYFLVFAEFTMVDRPIEMNAFLIKFKLQ